MLPTAKTNAKVAPPLQCEILDFYRATVMRVTDGTGQELLSRVSTSLPGCLDTQHTFRTHDGLVMQLYVGSSGQTGSALGIPHTWRDPTLEVADYQPRTVRFMQHNLDQCDIKVYFDNNDKEAESLHIEFYPPGFFAASASPSLPELHQEGAIAALVATLVASGADRHAQTERVTIDVATPPLANNRATLDFVLPNIPNRADTAREWEVEAVQLDPRYAEDDLPTCLKSGHETANRIFHAVAHRWEAAAIHFVRLLEHCAALAEPLERPMERRTMTLVPCTPEAPDVAKKQKRQRSKSTTTKDKQKKKKQKAEEEEESSPKPPRKRLSLRKRTSTNE
ncbi:hypothetical protein QKT49_gp098 [Acanthamoeba castellanii medusavirus]|uniref:Uncharacterized protein n=1 Tax=Acanthamoeba castellanii medusavirus J1 TaxID=3114988 RepID=A0A3T1CWP2_9VIRU|nr:hypothetical protein QKT49_gp098 [Acanthamoeba castellanii medusavirus]BBI30238.1 hypothetical protein [Acanthamoeba castellanii medusavirus J1]